MENNLARTKIAYTVLRPFIAFSFSGDRNIIRDKNRTCIRRSVEEKARANCCVKSAGGQLLDIHANCSAGTYSRKYFRTPGLRQCDHAARTTNRTVVHFTKKPNINEYYASAVELSSENTFAECVHVNRENQKMKNRKNITPLRYFPIFPHQHFSL